jgi:glycosyltransferase involved in cell wall biosynthesis
MTTLITHIYFSPFTHESRAMRAIDAALASGIVDTAEAIGYHDEGLAPQDTALNGITIRRWKVDIAPFLPRIFRRTLAWGLWTWKTARHIRTVKPLVVQAHSLAAMPAAALAKAMAGTPILYDAHELETERAGWGRLQRSAAKVLERFMIKRADQTIVVSQTIATWYAQEYGITAPALVRNMPKRATADLAFKVKPSSIKTSAPSLRRALNIVDGDMLYVYPGAIGYGRGIMILLEAFRNLPPNFHFCALGYGEYAELVAADAARYPNIHFHPAVPSETVLEFIRDADVGVSLIEDVCLSYRYCLPNKIFETRLAGLPVLSSDLPEMANFVETYGGGWVVTPEASKVAALVAKIDRAEIARVMADIRPVPTWEDDVPIYLESLRGAIISKKDVS